MIGKKDWFVRKTFGWGITPVTWQGWVYTLVFVAGIILIVHAPAAWFIHPRDRWIVEAVWAGLLLADAIHIWFKLKGKRDLF